MKSMTVETIVINETEVAFSIFNADDVARFEKAYKELGENTKDYNDMTLSEVVSKQCEDIHNFFDTLLYAGASDKIMQDRKIDLLFCMNCIEETMQQLDIQKDILVKKTRKYSSDRIRR